MDSTRGLFLVFVCFVGQMGSARVWFLGLFHV